MLNYGYGILYSEIERACVMAGLDPYAGFYHTERYGKPALVLDLIEEFRVPIVDSAIIPLFYQEEIEDNDIETAEAKKRLSKTGKSKVINKVFQRFHQEIIFERRKRQLVQVINLRARNLASFLVGRRENYYPFIFSDF